MPTSSEESRRGSELLSTSVRTGLGILYSYNDLVKCRTKHSCNVGSYFLTFYMGHFYSLFFSTCILFSYKAVQEQTLNVSHGFIKSP